MIQKSKYDPNGTYYLPKDGPCGMNIQQAVRVGQDERDWAAAILAERHVAGYLTPEEYEARRDQAFGAVTREQLNILLKDLPPSADDWKKIRKIEVAKADVIQQEPRRPSPFLNFPVGVLAVCTGATGIAVNPVSGAVFVQALALMAVGVIAILIGMARS